MRVQATGLAALMLLAACQKPAAGPRAHGAPSEAQPAAATAPASAPEVGGVDLANDLHLSGSAWSLDIGADQLKLERQGRPDLSAKNMGPQVAANTASWSATASDGSALSVTVTGKPCVDPGGVSQPLTAVVVIAAETLKGCATGTPVQVTDDAPNVVCTPGKVECKTKPSPPVDVE
ncbi:MAG TPA: hypothetical protein VG407_05625 [Caulobacteraceae bacterium]|jgi:uncharacterized membrane protein|nr:hypothetical protein [Caulobacteraceae bacterium]